MNADGISYLDIADAYLRADWDAAINAYWSPLYSWLLGLTLAAVKPSPHWEFATVHLVNFGIFILSAAAFEFFLSQLQHSEAWPGGRGETGNGAIALSAVGYALFLWSSLKLVPLTLVTPDLLVTAVLYTAFGLLLRIRRAPDRWAPFAALGFVLGIGYLAKSPIFLLAFVFLVVAVFIGGRGRAGFLRGLAALLMFAVVAGPFVWALSRAKGHPTFAATGPLAYAWCVNGFPEKHWQGDPPESGQPLHTTRRIGGDLPIFEFGTPIAATYPPHYDPSYWSEGLHARFRWKDQARATMKNARTLWDILVGLHGAPLIGLFLLCYVAARDGTFGKKTLTHWPLILPVCAALLLYATVLVHSRYVGAYFAVAFTALFAGLRSADRRLGEGVMLAIVVVGLLVSASASIRAGGSALRAARNSYPEVAEEVRRLGVLPGEKMASTRYSNRGNAWWARLARLRIVAELNVHGDEFWEASSAARSEALEAFARAGASIAVAEAVPLWADARGWQRVGETDYYLYDLAKLPRKRRF